jgi:integrase
VARKTQINHGLTANAANINPANIQLKHDFLDYLKSIKRSPGTIKGYDNDLDIFFCWVIDNAGNKDFVNITKRELVRFQNWLCDDNANSPARVRRIKAAISSLSNYIEAILDTEDEFKDFRSIVRKIESPTLQAVREKTVLTDEQVDKLLTSLTDSGKYEKACAVALAMFSGRRKAELPRFRMSDFEDDKIVCDGALYKSSPIQTKGRSGGKFIPCYTLVKDFKPYLEAWIKQREELGIESEWLLPDPSNVSEPLSITILNSWAKTFSRILDEDFYWHCCRHRYTTYLVRAGIPDGVIAEIVGWTSTDLVKVYTDIDADEQIGAFFKNGEICVEKKDSPF